MDLLLVFSLIHSNLLDMADDRIHDKTHEDSDSESGESDAEESFSKIEIDASKLTPLSPEVISKQVCIVFIQLHVLSLLMVFYRQRLT